MPVPTRKQSHPAPLRATSDKYGYLQPPSNLKINRQHHSLLIHNYNNQSSKQCTKRSSVVRNNRSICFAIFIESCKLHSNPRAPSDIRHVYRSIFVANFFFVSFICHFQGNIRLPQTRWSCLYWVNRELRNSAIPKIVKSYLGEWMSEIENRL